MNIRDGWRNEKEGNMPVKEQFRGPETILFVGAGATAALSMPTTQDQAQLLWRICDCGENDSALIEDATKGSNCFGNQGKAICELLKVLDGGARNDRDAAESKLLESAFPGVDKGAADKLVRNLRRRYDYAALKLVAKAKKNSEAEESRENFLQEVFTAIDACIHDGRGCTVYAGKEEIFLAKERLEAARQALILIINTMFACAWRRQTDGRNPALARYEGFFQALARTMLNEGKRFFESGCAANCPEFYQFSYSVVTTNFEPLFLWFIWQGHKDVNNGGEFRIGEPGRMLKLMMNFPNALGMSRLADRDEDVEKLDRTVWSPCTDAAAQAVNNPNYSGNRFFRFGKYVPVHGMCTTRHCPKCGKLNLYMGDTWDMHSGTLFGNGVTKKLDWGQVPRTCEEKERRNRGEYDALQCHFCGEITHSHDNFTFMQTQLKSSPPSFIKEATDEALAEISGAKHIVLLGYSMPLDDAIWGSLLSVMTRRRKGENVYCTVVDYIRGWKDGEKWLYGDRLDNLTDETKRESFSSAVQNAITVFGKNNVRAYVGGVPEVFGEGSEKDVLKLMYPADVPGWKIEGFTEHGVARTAFAGLNNAAM